MKKGVTMGVLRKFRTRLGLRKNGAPRATNLITVPGAQRKIHATWYRGPDTNFHPDRAALAESDAIEKYIGKGWFPATPIIDRQQYITAFGSCFAREVTSFLYDEGYRVFGRDLSLDAHVVRSGDGIVNSAALRQQFEWAFNGWEPSANLWHDRQGNPTSTSGEVKDTTRDIFQSTDVFIFTLGLSEVWYDKQTGDIFWRAIPKEHFDAALHGFRLLSPEENRANIRRVYEIIRENRPEAEIILTLSPVALAATFRPISCITANSVSKASLRVAIDDIINEFSADKRLHYFPSYEIATVYFRDGLRDDLRHPRREVVDTILKTFKQKYLI